MDTSEEIDRAVDHLRGMLRDHGQPGAKAGALMKQLLEQRHVLHAPFEGFRLIIERSPNQDAVTKEINEKLDALDRERVRNGH